jgi:hypothetical protein
MTKKEEYSILEKKSKENFRCANIAVQAGYHNCAVSRYYYACLLASACCAYRNGLIEVADLNGAPNSHKIIEDKFVNELIKKPELSLDTIARLKYFKQLKKNRIEAEYSHSKDEDYSLCMAKFESAKNRAKHYLESIDSIFKLQIIED